jgi:hypothetical protein
MKNRLFNKRMAASLTASGFLLLTPLGITAQEETRQQEGSGGHMGMRHMMGEHHKTGMMAGMQQHHEQMEKMQQEMTQELETQITALREHAKMMDGLTDEKQLLGEMKKHQQLSDAVLETLLKQRKQMHEQMRERMKKDQPSEGSETK